MRDDNTRNTIIFFVCAMLLLAIYQLVVIEPQAKKRQAELARQPAAAASTVAPGTGSVAAIPAISRETALAASPRVPISTPALKGSISLRGARIDDLVLLNYRQTLDPNSPPVELLRPEGSPFAQFADLGWTGANVPGLPNAQTVWTLAGGSVLAPGAPVTLTYTNGQGLTFTRIIAVDDKFMFTVTDTVANTSGQPVSLAPYGSVQRQGLPAELGKNSVVHEGGMGWLGKREPIKYRKWEKEGGGPAHTSTGGWIGITDHYWLAALIPSQQEQITGQYRLTRTPGLNVFDANYVGQPRLIPAGRQVSSTVHVFAGAKAVPVLRGYESSIGALHLDEAVDWGMLWFLTRPVFAFLAYIHAHVGNMGVAILLLTVVVRLVFFRLRTSSTSR